MSKLIYSMLASLDGYVSDSRGDFGWAAPEATMFFWEFAHTRGGCESRLRVVRVFAR